MTAVVSIVQNCGSSYAGAADEVAKSVFYFLPIDSCTAGRTANPITVPGIGVEYSYEIYLRARLDLAPNDRIENIKFWYSSGIPSGQSITVNSDVVSTYSKPVNLESTKGTRVDFTTKNAEDNAIDLSGTLNNVGDYSSYAVFQLEVSNTAETGIGFTVNWTVQYDEY